MAPRHDIHECRKSDAWWHNPDKEHVLQTTQIPGEANKKQIPGKVTGWARGAVGCHIRSLEVTVTEQVLMPTLSPTLCCESRQPVVFPSNPLKKKPQNKNNKRTASFSKLPKASTWPWRMRCDPKIQ